MGKGGQYVYCVIRSPRALDVGPIGIDAQVPEVSTVEYDGLAAVVSEVRQVPLDSTREYLLAHERVNEAVMRDHTVLPMSFGTVFRTRDDIVQLLRSARPAFTDVLARMADKVEFGLKVLWDRDAAVAAIERDDLDVARLSQEIARQHGSTYFARMQHARLLDAALRARAERHVHDLLAALRDVSAASRVDRVIGDRVIMNAAFLVDRAEEARFDARMSEIEAAHEGLTFRYTGPWPPYNFVNIRLRLDRPAH